MLYGRMGGGVGESSRDSSDVRELGTYAGGAVFHATKVLGPAGDSSSSNEGVPTWKLSAIVEYARTILEGLGVALDEPTMITSDNIANVRVSEGESSATRMRHELRRYKQVHIRCEAGKWQVPRPPCP